MGGGIEVRPTGLTIAPWGDGVGDVRVLDRPLAQVQRAALDAAGLRPGETLTTTDDLWLTPDLARRFVEAARASGRPAALALRDGLLTEYTGALQELGSETLGGHPCRVYPLTWSPAGADLSEVAPLVVPDDTTPLELPVHATIAPGGVVRLPMTHHAAIRIGHWIHVLRANQQELLAYGSRLTTRQRLRVLWAVVRALSFDKWRVMAKLTRRGPGCDIHPSAVVEASTLGAGVKIGAHAVVRFCHLSDGVVVGDHAHVVSSVLGAGAAVSRMGMLQGCVLYPGANTGHYGFQLCVIGRDTFVGGEVVLADWRPEGVIRVEHRGELVSTNTNLLGCAVGHDCRILMRATVQSGRQIPNGYTILGSQADVITKIPADLPREGTPLSVGREGRLEPPKGDAD